MNNDRPNGPNRPAGKRRGPVHLKGLRSLERLRDRVEMTARELERLRQENAALVERLRALEARTPDGPRGTTVAFDEPPEVLRRKVQTFIDAIDRYVEGEPES